MYHDHGYGYDGHPAFGWVLMLLFLVLLVILVVVAVRWLLVERSTRAVAAGGGPGRTDDALATVRMRYARGEMDRDEFLRVSDDLSGAPQRPPIPGPGPTP